MSPTEVNDDETIERLGPYLLVQRRSGHRLTTDAVLLADFAAESITIDDSVIDLGTATGAIPLMLAYKTRARRITGVEIDDGSVVSAGKNIEVNGLGDRVEVVRSDYRTLVDMYPEGAFTAVLSNPPYTKSGAGRVSPVKERAIARGELLGSLDDLVRVSSHLAGASGRIFYVFPAARLAEMLDEAQRRCLRVRRLRFVRSRPGKAASLFLIELARAGGLGIEDAVAASGGEPGR